MRLAEIEIMGFKSFPTRTVLNFNSGITSIIGPNGCGKSNLVDSIRWVLGEQSAKSLRGERMESVIFSGSNSRNQGSLAEVSLLIESNGDPSANGSDKTKVTRRLYRNGESEYLLNGVPCLLRDITELFADTGIGASAYTVMEQGMVEALISDRDESRREVFDEASGITKYKLKRRLAARKLESTEADLLRLTDLVSEVEKQVGSLKRQMRKAEGYKNLKDQLKELELKVNKKHFQDAGQKLSQLEQLLQSQQSGKENSGAQLATAELELEQLKLERLEIEKTIEIQRNDLEAISKNIFNRQEAVSVARQKTENLKGNLARLETELANLTRQKEELENNIGQKKVEAVTVIDRLEKIKTEQSVLQAEAASLQKETDSARSKLEELNQDWSARNLGLKEDEARVQNLRQRVTELSETQKEFNQSLLKMGERQSQLELSLKQRETETFQFQTKQAEFLKRKEELASAIAAQEEELTGRQKELGRKEAELSSERARREVLLEVWKSYEGYQEGVRKLVEQKEKFGLVDTVANLLKTEQAYLLAVEAALGEKAGYLVASNWEQALKAMEALREDELGEAGFVIAEPDKSIAENEVDSPDNPPSDLIPILRVIEPVQGNLPGFIRHLLSKVYLAKNISQAQELLANLPSDLVIVTPEGEVFSSLGLAKGGRKKGPTLLGRQEQIKLCEQKIDEMQRKTKELSDKINEIIGSTKAHKEELGKVDSGMEQVSGKLRQSEIDLTDFKAQNRHATEDIQSNQAELSKIESLNTKFAAEIEEIEAKVRAQKEGLNLLEAELSRQKEFVHQQEIKLTEANQRLNDKVIELITMQGQKERLEHDSLRLVEAVSGAQISLQEKAGLKQESHYEIQKTGEQIKADQEELGKLSAQKEKLALALNQQAESQHQLLEQINAKDQHWKTIRKAQSENQEEIHQSELARQELDSQIKQLKDRIWEEYEVDLEAVPELESAEFGQISMYQEEIYSLRNRLKSYGAVNLLALEDYQREKQRLDFLQKQVSDLISAKETLQSTITKINDTARSLFLETFEKVRANFSKVLAGLFEGGEADLILEEGVDPLEAKIEIMAKPRGKKLVTLALLSGGEKALVAISLLFSLYLVKPSPFCILDEVDAPLDDSNIGRFIKLVRQFIDKTQFVIITHNKLTMEAADTLYGVTMTEPGVSQIVSVQLSKEPVNS